MEENKFEKQVRQRMDNLKLDPSESVWENIKNRIEKRKDRKWGLLAFIFLFALLLSGGYWLYNSQDHSVLKNQEFSANSKTQGNDSASINKNNRGEENEKQNHIALGEKPISSGENENTLRSNEELRHPAKENPAKNKSYRGQKGGSVAVFTDLPGIESNNLPVKNDDRKQHEASSEPDNDIVSDVFTADILGKHKPVDDSLTVDVLQNENKVKESITQADTLANKPKKAFNQESKNKWHLGVFVAGGISHVGNEFLGFGYSNRYYTQSSAINGSPGPVYSNPSKVKNGGAFIAGAFLEKNISPKTKISFGINYKEFNTSNLVGPKNDTTGAYQALRFSQNHYYNNFKFIELPVQIRIRLGKSKTFPVFWSGGLTISQLINSNALQFNQYAGTYYKDNSLFNKTQIGINTGFTTALFQGQKSSILLGPYFHYTASQLANEGLYNKKHFVFFGLRSELILGKK